MNTTMEKPLVKFTETDFINISGKDLAKMTGFAERQISHWCYGRPITEGNLEIMASSFSIPKWQMMRWLDLRRARVQASGRAKPWNER